MKTMINSIILASCLALPLASCSDSDAAPEQKDWSTTTYFNSSDAAAQDTYYQYRMYSKACLPHRRW